MIHMLFKYGTVFVGSMFKFVFGPVSGQMSGLGMTETILLTIAGMMTSVVIFSLLGLQIRTAWMRRFKTKRLKFTPKNRRIVAMWSKFGLPGVAFFTPILLSPIIGTILAVSFGEQPRRIMTAMFASAVFWGVALTYFFHVLGKNLG